MKKQKYKVVCFMRIDEEEENELLSLEEAKTELEQAQELQPENRYEIEEVGDDE